MKQKTILFGGPLAIKSQEGELVTVGGQLVHFSGPTDPDLFNTYFTKDTYFGPYRGDGMDVRFNHRIPVSAKTPDGNIIDFTEIANYRFNPMKVTENELGLFAETVLNMREKYEKLIAKLVEKKALAWSSGTSYHMIKLADNGWIAEWPIIEGSFTPTPAEPKNLLDIKTFRLTKRDPNFWINQKEANKKTEEVIIMTEPTQANSDPIAERLKATEGRLDQIGDNIAGITEALGEQKTINDRINQLLEIMENSPAAEAARMISNYGGKADPNNRSYADFLLALKRNDRTRLQTVYSPSAAEMKDSEVRAVVEGEGEAGGFIVPREFEEEIRFDAGPMSIVRPRATIVPVNKVAGDWPSLNVYKTPTLGVGDTAWAAGVTTETVAETGGTSATTQPDFTQLTWRVNKIQGRVEVSNDINEDAPQQLNILLQNLFATAIAAKEDFAFFRGTGANEPLGIINSAAAYQYTLADAAKFQYADALGMLPRLYDRSGRAAWVMHRSVLPQVGVMEIGSAGAAPLINDIQGQAVGGLQIFNYPILTSQWMSLLTNDNSVMLADFSSYLIFQRRGLTVRMSEHEKFSQDLTVWVFDTRIDGMPWPKATMKEASVGGAYEISPFVTVLKPS